MIGADELEEEVLQYIVNQVIKKKQPKKTTINIQWWTGSDKENYPDYM